MSSPIWPQPGRRRAPAERAVWASGRDGAAARTANDRGTDDTLRPSRAKPPATAGPIGPPAPHSRVAVRSHSAAAGPGWAQLSVPGGAGPVAGRPPRPPSGLWAACASTGSGAVVDPDLPVDGGGARPVPTAAQLRPAASSALGWVAAVQTARA